MPNGRAGFGIAADPETNIPPSGSGFNVGAIINLTEDYHVLLSAGRDIDGASRFSSYAAFQWTFAPHEEEKK